MGPTEQPTSIKVVAGVVGEGGTVHYLPRVNVRLIPNAYSDAEREATEIYSAQIHALTQARDATLKKLVEGHRRELASAKDEYERQFKKAMDGVTLDPLSAVPDCMSYEDVVGGLGVKTIGVCGANGVGTYTTVHLSPQLRKLLVHPAVIGIFDVHTFSRATVPVHHLKETLYSIPLESYQEVPEFSEEIEKAIKKARDRAKVKGTAPLPPTVARAAVQGFVDEWFKETTRYYYYSGNRHFANVQPRFFVAAANFLEEASKRTVQSAADTALSAYVAAKDQINSSYDVRQAVADATFKAGVEAAERKRATALESAMKQTPPVQETATSLQGEAMLTIPPGDFTITAEDTTTDQHLRWNIPVPRNRASSSTIELTDGNALKATPTTIASAAAQPTYPKAAALSETDRAEYNLRYSSRLLKSWSLACVAHSLPEGDQLELLDSPLGFAFQLRAASTDVFNTLRMTDNDIAARLFKDVIAPYLQVLPSDLRTIGGSQTFEAVSLQITGHKKSFLNEGTNGDRFVLTYAFRIADVESYANQKIDAQQLLDRSHITDNQVGRISVKLVAAQ
jgi:hypothetical protein